MNINKKRYREVYERDESIIFSVFRNKVLLNAIFSQIHSIHHYLHPNEDHSINSWVRPHKMIEASLKGLLKYKLQEEMYLQVDRDDIISVCANAFYQDEIWFELFYNRYEHWFQDDPYLIYIATTYCNEMVFKHLMIKKCFDTRHQQIMTQIFVLAFLSGNIDLYHLIEDRNLLPGQNTRIMLSNAFQHLIGRVSLYVFREEGIEPQQQSWKTINYLDHRYNCVLKSVRWLNDYYPGLLHDELGVSEFDNSSDDEEIMLKVAIELQWYEIVYHLTVKRVQREKVLDTLKGYGEWMPKLSPLNIESQHGNIVQKRLSKHSELISQQNFSIQEIQSLAPYHLFQGTTPEDAYEQELFAVMKCIQIDMKDIECIGLNIETFTVYWLYDEYLMSYAFKKQNYGMILDLLDINPLKYFPLLFKYIMECDESQQYSERLSRYIGVYIEKFREEGDHDFDDDKIFLLPDELVEDLIDNHHTNPLVKLLLKRTFKNFDVRCVELNINSIETIGIIHDIVGLGTEVLLKSCGVMSRHLVEQLFIELPPYPQDADNSSTKTSYENYVNNELTLLNAKYYMVLRFLGRVSMELLEDEVHRAKWADIIIKYANQEFYSNDQCGLDIVLGNGFDKSVDEKKFLYLLSNYNLMEVIDKRDSCYESLPFIVGRMGSIMIYDYLFKECSQIFIENDPGKVWLSTAIKHSSNTNFMKHVASNYFDITHFKSYINYFPIEFIYYLMKRDDWATMIRPTFCKNVTEVSIVKEVIKKDPSTRPLISENVKFLIPSSKRDEESILELKYFFNID